MCTTNTSSLCKPLIKDGYELFGSYRSKLRSGLLWDAAYYAALYINHDAKHAGMVIVLQGVFSGTYTYLSNNGIVGLESGNELQYRYIFSVSSPHFTSNALGDLTDAEKALLVFDAITTAMRFKEFFKSRGPTNLVAVSNGTLMFHAFASNLGIDGRYREVISRIDNVVLCCPPSSIPMFALNTIDHTLNLIADVRPISSMRKIKTRIGDVLIRANIPSEIPSVAMHNRTVVSYGNVEFTGDLKMHYIYEFNDCGVDLRRCLKDFITINQDNAKSFCISNDIFGGFTGHGQIYREGGNMPRVKNILRGKRAQSKDFIQLDLSQAKRLLSLMDVTVVDKSFQNLYDLCEYLRSDCNQSDQALKFIDEVGVSMSAVCVQGFSFGFREAIASALQ